MCSQIMLVICTNWFINRVTARELTDSCRLHDLKIILAESTILNLILNVTIEGFALRCRCIRFWHNYSKRLLNSALGFFILCWENHVVTVMLRGLLHFSLHCTWNWRRARWLLARVNLLKLFLNLLNAAHLRVSFIVVV